MDPNNPVITLPDGTTAQVQGVAQMDPGQGVHTLAEVASQHSSLEVGQTSTGELQENGHIIITSDDGAGMFYRSPGSYCSLGLDICSIGHQGEIVLLV